MTAAALAKARDLLDGSAIDAVASWADVYRHNHRETGPWHYINIPLADSKIDLVRACPSGDWVIAKTEQFLTVLKDPNAEKNAKALNRGPTRGLWALNPWGGEKHCVLGKAGIGATCGLLSGNLLQWCNRRRQGRAA